MPTDDVRRSNISRRTVLKYGGVTAGAVVLAGCSSEEPEDSDGGGDGGDGGDGGAGGDGGDGGDGGGDGGDGDLDEVIVTQGSHTGTLDPQDFTGSPARSIIFNAYEKLISLDFLGDGTPIPELASDWERVEDDVLRIHIREGINWHEGGEFTKQDAAYSINRVADPDVGMTTRRELLNVESAEVVDDENAIDLQLTAPDPIIVQRLGFAGGVISQDWAEENDQDIGRMENGTGPYRLVDFEPDVSATFERLDPDEYWDPELEHLPAVDRSLEAFPEQLTYQVSSEASTRISQLLAEETHIIEDVLPEDMGRINDSGHAEIRDVATDRSMMLMMKYDVEPFSDLQFRQALNHAVDKETLIETVLEGLGEVTHQVTPETWFGHDPGLLEEDMYPYDPDRAEELIDESGYAGEEITLAVPQGRYLKDSEVGQAIAGQLDSLSNLSVDVEIREWSTHRDLIAPEYDDAPPFHFFGFGSAPNDASIKIDRNFTTGRLDSDFSIFSDDDIDALSEEAANTLDPDGREEILQEANRVVMEKAACVPIYFQAALYGANTDVVDFTPIPKEEIYWFSMVMQ